MSLLETIKQNKLLKYGLIFVGAYILLNLFRVFFGVNILSLTIPQQSKTSLPSSGGSNFGAITPPSLGGVSLPSYSSSYYQQEYTPQADVKDRLVIQESSLSLLVKNVTEVRNKIVEYAQNSGGYMVSSNISNPQDAPTATVVVRVPSEKLEESLNFFRSQSVKVVSENLLGKDVTDQYVDIDARIAQLEKTKARIEAILDQATQISDITNLTTQVINYQNQIDSLKGQQISLEKNAQLAKLTIYLSTDEIALPYAPSETFRPNIIFKLAVRSLVGNLRKIVSIVIWIGVYAVIWVPVLLIFILVKRFKNKKVVNTPSS